MYLNNFHLQVVEVRVIEVELALERPIRHTAALAQQCEDLIQHRVKVHNRLSPCLSGNARAASVGCAVNLSASSQGEDSVSPHGIRLSQKMQEHPMSRTRQYHKRQAKAIQRRRRPAAERLQRDHVQAQRAIKALEQALHEVGLPDNLVKEIGGSSIVFGP